MSELCNNESNSSAECLCELPYFLPREVALHNCITDCWVSFNGYVCDLTELCKKWVDGKAIKPILAHAGKDISHWFDPRTGDIKYYTHPVTGKRVPYCPHGVTPDITTSSNPVDTCPWWFDEKYRVGYLTRNERPCRIINVLTGQEIVLPVCEEDTIARIQQRALRYNAHATSYTWKFEGKYIDLSKTLSENGIVDERERYQACGLPDDTYIPSLLCYYNDDLSEK